MIYFAGGILLTVCFFVWRIWRTGKRSGIETTENDTMKQILDDIHVSSQIRDKLKHNDDYSRRVRERFTRD